MKVEIWSDIMCPFCYIGKRRFEEALNGFEQKDQVEVIWRSFQLDPELVPVPGMSIHEYLAERKGVSVEEGRQMNDYMTNMAKEVNLQYNFDKTILNNTLDAHRLLHLAATHGVQGTVKELLFRAYYTEGKDVGSAEVLIEAGRAAGIDPEEITEMFESDRFIREVRADQREAQELGANGVPFFVVNRQYGVSGAQPAAVFTQLLQTAFAADQLSLKGSSPEGPSCGPEGNC